MSGKAAIVCLGEPMAEFSQLPDGPPGHYLAGHGGDTSNCAIAAARQGAAVGYVTVLGADRFGDSFVDLWRREGVDNSGVGRDEAAHTAVYFIDHGPDGHRFSYLRAGSAASRMRPEDLPKGLIAEAQVLHVSGISQAISASASDTVFRAIEIARANGTKVSYDPNLRLSLWPLARARAVIHAGLAGADYVLTNLEEGRQLTGATSAEAVAEHYLGLEVGTVVVKMGADGALLASGAERHRMPGHAVAAIDASGAGDTFDGAFLAEIVRGADNQAAATYANAAAALSTTGYGAVAPIPRRADVEALLKRR
ncbi:MAG: sugar kinase, partial [Alphaproteobacteria bacterium]|nr:sugar kinase [Alphaproteobacteria bacterium]